MALIRGTWNEMKTKAATSLTLTVIHWLGQNCTQPDPSSSYHPNILSSHDHDRLSTTAKWNLDNTAQSNPPPNPHIPRGIKAHSVTINPLDTDQEVKSTLFPMLCLAQLNLIIPQRVQAAAASSFCLSVFAASSPKTLSHAVPFLFISFSPL